MEDPDRDNSLLYNNNYNNNDVTYNLFQENSSRELEEPHDYASMFEEEDQEGGNTGYGHANNEISIRDEPDGKNKGIRAVTYNTKCYMLIEINK